MKIPFITVEKEKMNKEFIIYNNSYLGPNTIKHVYQDLQINKPKIALYWCAMEWELPGTIIKEDYDELERVLVENNIQFYLLLGSVKSDSHPMDYIYPKNNFKILYWPTYFLHIVENELNYGENNISLLYSCLNNVPHYHRCMMIDKLHEAALFDYGQISWNNINNEYSKYTFKSWEQEIIQSQDNFLQNNNSFETAFMKNDRTLISLTTESTSKVLFHTEKIFKPLSQKKPFISLGDKNQNLDLKNYGFELFEEIFNYDFDEKIEIASRVNGIIDNLILLKNRDYSEIYEQLKPKLDYNRKKLLDIQMKDSYIPEEILDLVQKYKDEFSTSTKDKISPFFNKFL